MTGGHSESSLQAGKLNKQRPNTASAHGDMLWMITAEAQWEAAICPPNVKGMAVHCNTRSPVCQLYSLVA